MKRVFSKEELAIKARDGHTCVKCRQLPGSAYTMVGSTGAVLCPDCREEFSAVFQRPGLAPRSYEDKWLTMPPMKRVIEMWKD